jgi:hypothetical protein
VTATPARIARNLDRYYPYDATYLGSGWPGARQQRSSTSARHGLIRKGPPPMATVEEGLQAQIRNIEATYGKPMSEWLAIIAASGLTKHTDIVNMLKNDYGMTHGAAHRVSILARERPIVCVSDRGGFHGVGIRPSK